MTDLSIRITALGMTFLLGLIVGLSLDSPPPNPPVAFTTPRELSAESEQVAGVSRHEEPPPPLPKEPPSLRTLAQRSQASTVAIRNGLRYGAGVVLPGGLVLTSWHVVEDHTELRVITRSGENGRAVVVDHDETIDLAILKMQGVSAPAAEVGTTETLTAGDEVLAVGSPRKMYFSVSRGIVSFVGRPIEGVSYLQTDLPINSGNSGGPLFDRDGRLVGIVSFILRNSQGVSFAIPIDYALDRFGRHLRSPHTVVAAEEAGRGAGATSTN